VVKNGLYENWSKEVRPYMFTPLAQNDEAMDFPLTLLLRTTREAKDMVATVRSQVASLDRNLTAFDIKSVTEQIHQTLSLPRMGALLTGMFGSLGLMLAVVGIYGLVSYTATRSTHEIGLRIALGAERRDVLKLMLTQGMVLTVTGLIIGLAVSLTVNRLLSNLLFGVTTNDPVTFCVCAGVSDSSSAVGLLRSCPARSQGRSHRRVAT
jgi:putative ABC transport system permease protein